MPANYSNDADLLPNILPLLPGCPDNLALQMISRAAREFFSKSEVWTWERSDIGDGGAAIDVTADEGTYELDDSGQELRRVLWLKISGVIVPACHYDLHTTTNGWIEFKPDYVPTVTVTGGLTCKYVLVPIQGGDTYASPALILDRWHVPIENKAVEHLASMPRREWTDERLAALSRQRYNRELNRAIKTRFTGGTTMSLRATGDSLV